jgi:hypothetical protein
MKAAIEKAGIEPICYAREGKPRRDRRGQR